MIVVSLLKLATEIVAVKFLDQTMINSSSSNFVKVLLQDLINLKLYHPELIESKVSIRTPIIIYLTNFMDIGCVTTLWLFDKKIKNRINLSHLPSMKKILAIFLAPYKILIYLLLLIEVLQINMNFFTLIYVMLFYMLMRA